MILTVSHISQYRYATPLRGSVHSLRLTPSVFDGQRAIDWNINIEGGVKGADFRDGAGDQIQGWSVRGPVAEVSVKVTGKVETKDLTGVLRGHRETVPSMAYLRATNATRSDAALTGLALGVAGPKTDRLEAAHRLSDGIADAIAYRPGVTEAHTTAAEALALGEGVCQDHTHAMIAGARVLGLPARYVSGYLFSDADGNAHEAAHAWAELWVDGLGWVGFDASNRCCSDDRYIRLGSGYDAHDAAPIRGIAQGMASESLEVTVAIQSVQQ